MGIFKRISNMISGKANSLLDDIENPIELLEQEIKQRADSVQKAKLASAEFIGSIERDERELKELKSKRDKRESEVRATKEKGDIEMAKRFLAKKLELDKKIDEKTTALESKKVKANQIKENLSNLEKEVTKLSDMKVDFEMDLANAKALKDVNEIFAGISPNGVSVKDLERKIASIEDTANGLQSFKPVDEDKELDEYASNMSIDLDSELEKY